MTWRRVLVIGGLVLVLLPAVLIVAVMPENAAGYGAASVRSASMPAG